jgi:2-oxoglutarate dehydrogenase E1 component
MDREFFLGTWAGVAGFLSEERPVRTLREILTRLRETYSGNIGYEVRNEREERVLVWRFLFLVSSS